MIFTRVKDDFFMDNLYCKISTHNGNQKPRNLRILCTQYIPSQHFYMQPWAQPIVCQLSPWLPHGQSQWRQTCPGQGTWRMTSLLDYSLTPGDMSTVHVQVQPQGWQVPGQDRSLHIRLGLGAGWLTIQGIIVRECNIIWNRSLALIFNHIEYNFLFDRYKM